MRRRRKRGRQIQAIGISRGGRTTKIHALTDGLGRLVAFCLTAGHVADCRAAESLLQGLPHNALVMADRAYDTNAIRQQIEQQGAVPNIPPKRTRIWKSCFSRVLYRRRNAIERMFCRLKDYRRIATRYDKLATNFASSVCLAAAISFWL
jgi:transposase